jgi:hypothetical protein
MHCWQVSHAWPYTLFHMILWDSLGCYRRMTGNRSIL